MSRSTSWIFLFLPLTGLNFESSGGEKHSLIYIYTTFSKNPDLPGLHQFTAMGLLDGKTVSYFDSDTRKMEPRQDWMKDRLPPGYWTKRTESFRDKEQWSKDIIQTLKDRLRKNDNDMHVLQWMHGCEATLTDGTPKLYRSIDQYCYDGEDFRYFDNKLSVRAPHSEEWVEITVVKENSKDYMEKDCVGWLSTFLGFQERQLKKATPLKVFLFSKKTKDPSTVFLICFTTGFYPSDIELNIKRDDRILYREDGVKSSGTRPNGDDTYQRRDMVEILQSDTAKYSCEVIHRGSKLHVEKQWCGVCPKDALLCLTKGELVWTVAVAVVVLVLSVGITVALDRNFGCVPSDKSKKKENVRKTSVISADSNNTDGSGQLLTPVSSVYVDVPNPSSQDHKQRLDL